MIEEGETMGLGNPFPATAVAALGTSSVAPQIQTAAVKQAAAFLSDYLARSNPSSPESQAGSVVAIVGEYGTGKTHLALSILESVLREDLGSIKGFYLDAPADTFIALYRDRFIPRLLKREVKEQVEDYLGEVLTEQLRANPMTAPAADALRSGTIAPLELMSRIGLIESDLMTALRAKLAAVTERDDFATAFSLFIRPEFEDAVWEWLRGNEPDATLRDRGITVSLDTEPAVLEAMGVFAFLFGRAGHRFVLLMDEMEKVLTPASGRSVDEATVLAFKKFMESVGHTRSLLVLVGLPDFLEVLPEDTLQRMSAIIRPSPLSSNDIAEYIRQSNARVSGEANLAPFSIDSIEYVSDITAGNARKVVRMCFLAYQTAESSGSQVTRATIREVARDQFESSSPKDAASELTRFLDGTGWQYSTNATRGSSETTSRTWWIPIGSTGGGIMILLARSILQESDFKMVTNAIEKRRSKNKTATRSVLVVNGYLAETFSKRVSQAFDRVLAFSDTDFKANFEAVVRGLRQQLEVYSTANQLDRLSERVDQVARQLTYLIDNLEQSDRTKRDFSTTAIESALRRVFAQLGDERRSVPGYESAFQLIDRTEAMLESARLEESGSLRAETQLLSGDDALLWARDYVKRFREDAWSVLSSESSRTLFGDDGDVLRRLETVCISYDRDFTRIFERSRLELGNAFRGDAYERVLALPRDFWDAVRKLRSDRG